MWAGARALLQIQRLALDSRSAALMLCCKADALNN